MILPSWNARCTKTHPLLGPLPGATNRMIALCTAPSVAAITAIKKDCGPTTHSRVNTIVGVAWETSKWASPTGVLLVVQSVFID